LDRREGAVFRSVWRSAWARRRGCRAWMGAAVAGAVLAAATGARGQTADPEMLSILADMVSQQNAFRPERLHALGLDGLRAVLDEVLPETAEPAELTANSDEIAKRIEQLGDANYQTRRAATEKLVRLGRAVEPQLVEAARRPDPEISWRARRILRHWEKRQTEDKSRYLPALAVYAAGIDDEPRLREILRRTQLALKSGLRESSRQQVLRQCIVPLARAGKDEYLEPFVPLLKDADVQVAVLVVGAVGEGSRGGRFPDLLVEALRSDRPEVATAAVYQVRASTDESRREELEPLLLETFRRSNDALKLQAATVLLHKYDSAEGRDYLLERAEGADRNARYQALSALATTDNSGKEIDKRVLEVLRRQIRSKESTTRRLAARALARYRGDEVLTSLVPLLADEQRSTAAYVRQMLLGYPDKEALRKRLKAASEDHGDEKLRAAAGELLGALQ